MKIKTLVGAVILTFLGVLSAQAQEFHLGLEAGETTSSFYGSDQIQGSRSGLAGGVFATIGLGDLALQPEALYIRKGAQTLDGTSSFETDYIEIPILVKYYLKFPLLDPDIFIGPYGAFNTLAQAQNGVITNPSSTDWGGIVGAEVNLYPFSLSARWELGFTHVTSDSSIQNRTFDVLLGYSFI
jgi:hypothetical protein